MKLLFSILICLMVCSCGKKDHGSNPISANEINNQSKQALNLEKEINLLIKSGLHFARFSNLQDPKRPTTLYCSNTESLNHEKIEKLIKFSDLLKTDNQEAYLINKVEVSISTLLQLLEDAIKMLERDPYTTTCPQIYLAIQNN